GDDLVDDDAARSCVAAGLAATVDERVRKARVVHHAAIDAVRRVLDVGARVFERSSAVVRGSGRARDARERRDRGDTTSHHVSETMRTSWTSVADERAVVVVVRSED